MAHWQCKYCDRPAGYMGIPINVDDDELICACGAEWADAKILDDNDYDEDTLNQYSYDIDEEPWWSDPDGDEDCNEDNYDEIEEIQYNIDFIGGFR